LRGDLARDLEETITQKQPGDTLPSEAELAGERHISRTTVRAAYDELEARGLVTSGPGTRRRVAARLLLEINVTRTADRAWGGQLPTEGADSWVFDVIHLGHDAQELLSVRAGEEGAIIRELERTVDGIPHNIATWTFPGWLARATRLILPETIDGGSIPYLAVIGYEPDAYAVQIETAMPDRAEAAALQMPPGTPLLITRRTGWHGERMVFTEVTRWRGDQTRLRLDY
jgi:GntR family transcriptional regulator